jgi:hypothetical protein
MVAGAFLGNGMAFVPQCADRPDGDSVSNFCKTSSFSAGGQGSGGRIATMIEIEIPEDDLSGVDAKQRTTSPMADDLAFPCDFNVDSV